MSTTIDNSGHLFGDAIFNADFWALQNTNGEEIIKYTKDDGLEISGFEGGGTKIYVQQTEPEGFATGEWWYKVKGAV